MRLASWRLKRGTSTEFYRLDGPEDWRWVGDVIETAARSVRRKARWRWRWRWRDEDDAAVRVWRLAAGGARRHRLFPPGHGDHRRMDLLQGRYDAP